MYFKRIEIQGFKSFAEPVVVDFHPGVTCIVGPNGSGKSNISDAIRWVLGEQSPRMLRGGKMEEVIFNGTASRKSRGMAEVTLVIDNSQGILPTDYNEVAITRRMYRSGESEYLINNNQCRLRDVRELIMDTGIGVDGYSIIGQGKVQNIIEGKPEERREILEESAGVVMYKSRKREAENKLDKANVNLDRLNDIIYEIESRIGGLKEDSEKAKEALEISAKKKDLDINIALHNIDRLNAQGSTSEEDAEALKEDIEKHKADKAGLDEKIEEERLKNEKLQALGDKAREELLSIVNKLNDIKNKTQMDETRLSAMDSDVERLTAEIEALNTRLEKEMTSNEEKENTLFGMEEDLTKATKALEAEIDGYNKIMSVSISKQQSLEDIKNEILELSRKSSGLRSES
ncbi:MAG: AAA family ATPase [Firmicutes bacterium]|nr:AAA family ATPase [Bacillota bacterium]